MHLPIRSPVRFDNPVTLPPGRARLLTSTVGDRIADGRHHDGSGGGGALGGERRQGARRDDHIDVQRDELSRVSGEPLGFALGVPVLLRK